MKAKIIRTILPTILGVFAVISVLIIYNLIVHKGLAFSKPDNGFFKYLVPITTIIAMIIQLTITLPFWKKFKTHKRILGLTIVQFTALVCLVSGLIFGFTFWERSFGIIEFVLLSLTGIIAFSIYWTVNFLSLRQLDRF